MNEHSPDRTSSVLWRALRTRWWLVGASVAVGALGAGAMVSMQDAEYRAEATVLIDVSAAVGLGVPPNSPAGATRVVASEIQLVESDAVAERVRADLSLASDPPAVRAAPVRETNALTIAVSAGTAEAAADLANGYALAYIAESRRRDEVEIDARRDALLAEVSSTSDLIAGINAALGAAEEPELTRLTERKAQVQELLVSIEAEIAELNVTRRTLVGHGEITRPATAPAAPFEPKPVTSFALGALLGLFVGVAGAVLLERSANPLGDRREVERVIGSVPVLASLPQVPAHAAIVAPSSPDSALTNQLRLLERLMNPSGDRHGVVVVTSAHAGDGKSTLVANLALQMSASGQRVVVIDGDMHRPRQADLFDKAPSPGLADALLGGTPADLQRVNNQLYLLAAGTAPDPGALLGHASLRRLLTALHKEFDIVIVDAPPVQPLADAVLLASCADRVVVVAAPSITDVDALRESLRLLQRAGATVSGVVLNAVADTPSTVRYDNSEEPIRAATDL